MSLYDFTRLIQKYSVPFILVVSKEGRYESGQWIPGETVEREMYGAIIPMSQNKIYQSGGTYTAQDRELYLPYPIPEPLDKLKVMHRGITYKVESMTDYSLYADAAHYNLKVVSLFD